MASAIRQAAPDRAPSALGPPDRSIDGGREYDLIGPNNQIADKLDQASDILVAQGADPFRITAYRRAAESIRGLETDLGTIAEKGGRKAIEAIPGVGASIGSAIAEMLTSGRWGFLDHLKGTASPETLFQSVPGIGPGLARRVCETIQVHTLEALEAAAHDGRLEQVRGPESRTGTTRLYRGTGSRDEARRRAQGTRINYLTLRRWSSAAERRDQYSSEGLIEPGRRRARMQPLCGSVILHGNIFAGVVGHEGSRYQTHHCAGSHIDRNRIPRMIGGEQRRGDEGGWSTRYHRGQLIA